MISALVLCAVLAGGSPCHDFLDADLDRSGRVDVLDLIDLLLCYGRPACDAGDVDRDGNVDVLDLVDLLDAYGTDDSVCNWVDICTASDLNLLRSDPLGNFRIICDLNFPSDWEPIAEQVFPFSGSLVAAPGVTLNNLRINHPDDDDGTGLFAWAASARLLDLHFVDADVTGGEFVGTLAGYVINGTRVEGCTVDGSVDGDRYTGGLVGQNRSATLIDCHTDVTVTAAYGSSYFTGGLAGQVYSSALVSRCSSVCDIPVAWRDVGGLVGHQANGIIRRSWAHVTMGNVRGGVGGLVGDSFGLIEDCYATGSISAHDWANPSPWCGGLVGAAFSMTVRRCWSDVSVDYTGDEPSVGSFVGRRGGTSHPWSSNHYNDATNPGYPGCGEGSGEDIHGRPEVDMHDPATYAGWDFNEVWMMGGDYPLLR